MALTKQDKVDVAAMIAEGIKTVMVPAQQPIANTNVKAKPKSWNLSTKQKNGKWLIEIEVDNTQPGVAYENKSGKISSFQLAGAYGRDGTYMLPFTGPNGSQAYVDICVHYKATPEE